MLFYVIILVEVSSMKGNKDRPLQYSILTDPHMYYYLQSPLKVQELLNSQLYAL